MTPATSKPHSSTTTTTTEEGKLDADRNSSPSPSSPGVEEMESRIHKIVGKSPQGSSQPKRTRDESSQNLKPAPSKMSKKASGVDLEELLAQTYPKEALSTPTAQEEVRRSSRAKYRPLTPVDYAKKWSGNEEISVARALLETCSPSGELNMNMFYQRAKEERQKEMSNSQLYDKARSMGRRFRSIQSRLQEQSIPEHSFAFRTPQEPALFQMWKQIWGNNTTVSSPNGGQTARDGSLSEAENPREIQFGDKAQESQDERAAAEESTGDRRQREEEEPHQRNLQGKLLHQTLAENVFKTPSFEQKRRKIVVESSEDGVEAAMEGLYNRPQASSGGGFTCSILWRRMKELMGAVNSVEEFPGLSAAQAKELQQKWRSHRIQELKMLSDSFGLLHDQCTAFLENLDN